MRQKAWDNISLHMFSNRTSHVVEQGCARLKELTVLQIFMESYAPGPVSCLHGESGPSWCWVDLAVEPPSGNRGELSMRNFCALSASHQDCTDIVCSSTRILLPSLVSSAAIEVFQPASSSRLRYLSKVSLCIRSVSSRIMRVA